MTGEFDPNNNFIINILRKKYDVILSDSPDYLIFSLGSKDWYKFRCIRIYYTPENLVPDFNLADYAIGFSDLKFLDRYFQLPIYLVNSFHAYKNDDYGKSLKLAMEKHLHPEIHKNFCSFVYSNSKAAPCREQFFDELSKYKKVDSGGRYRNNIGHPIESKFDFQKNYRFALAFENTSTPGYTTEKLVDAFAAGTIPIYWGDPEVGKIFNNKAFINCNEYGLDGYDTENNIPIIHKIIEKITNIENHPEMLLQMLKQPAFNNPAYVSIMQKGFEEFLYHIFDQELDQAFRRNRYYWGERYEKRQKLGTQTYSLLNNFRPKMWFSLFRKK